MKKTIIIRVVQAAVILVMVWLIFALRVSYSTAEEQHKLASQQRELLSTEKAKNERLQSKLDSCFQLLIELKK